MSNKINFHIVIQSILLSISSFIVSSGIFNNPYNIVYFSINIITFCYILLLMFGGEFIIFFILLKNTNINKKNLVFSIIYNCIFLSILYIFTNLYIIWCLSYTIQQIIAILIIEKINTNSLIKKTD